jgi:hypothetical protein
MPRISISSRCGRRGLKKGPCRIFYAVLCTVILFAPCSTVAQSRFLRVLSLYKYSVYQASDRDILCNFDYDADKNQKRPTDLGFDTLYDEYQTFHRTLAGNLSVRLAARSGNKAEESSRTFEAGIRGNLTENATVRTNELLALGDTMKEQTTDAELFASYALGRKTHFGFRKYDGMPFWSLQGSASLSARDKRFKRFSSTNLTGTSWSNTGNVSQICQAPIFCAPSIGWGWPVPVWPVYYAFEIERKLKETGAIRHEFSDTTLLKIACLVATRDVYTLKYDLPHKYFMADLDTLLRKDSVLDSSRQGLYTAFKVDEAVNHSFPVFFSGFSAELFLWERIIVSYEHNYYMYSNLASTNGVNFDQENSLGFRGSWGFPVTGLLFGRVSVYKPFLSTAADPLIHSWESALTWDWDVEAFYFVTNRFLVSAGLSRLDAWAFVPKQWPQRSFLDATVFLEDHFRLTLTLSKTYSDEYSDYGFYNGGYVPLFSTSTIQSDNISLRVDYDY